MSDGSLQYIKDVLSGSVQSDNNSHWKYEHNVLSVSSDPYATESTQSMRYISNCFESSNISFPLLDANANRINCSALYHSDILSLSITAYNNDTTERNIDNEFATCDSPMLITIPHRNNHTIGTQHNQCFVYNESADDWTSSSCITITQSMNETQCACYTNMRYNNSNQIVSFMLSESQSIGFNDLVSEFGIFDNTQICIASIIFVSIWWIVSLILYCVSPIHDDVPLIAKNVIIPSQFRYRMFTHTKEGRINDLLRHRTGTNVCQRINAIACVYFDNEHMCCSLWRRNIGTNIYHGERVLFLLFHALFIAFFSLFYILLTQHSLISTTRDDEFLWMLIIAIITLFVMQSLIHCVGSSTPNRLTPETIDALVESERQRITAMKEETARASLPKKRPEKTFDAQYWSHKFNFAEKEIEKVIHNDLESRSLPADVAQWSVSQVGIWIHSLGLARYQSEFEHHRIDGKGLLRMHLDDIKQCVTEKKDIEFLHARLHKLKQKWRYRYVSLRQRRKKAKEDALKIAQQKKEQREKMLQQVRMKSINTQIKQKPAVPDIGPENTQITKRESKVFMNFKHMFGGNSNKKSFDKSAADESNANVPQHIDTSAPVTQQRSMSTIRTPITSRLQHLRSQIHSLKNVYSATPVVGTKMKRKHTDNVDVNQINRYLDYFEEEDRDHYPHTNITLMAPQMSKMSTMNSASFAEHHENATLDNRESATIGSETLKRHADGKSLVLFQPSMDMDAMNSMPEDVEIEIDLYGNDEFDLPLESDNDTESYGMENSSESKEDIIEWPETAGNIAPTQPSMNAPKPMWNANPNHTKPLPARPVYNKQLPPQQINPPLNTMNPQINAPMMKINATNPHMNTYHARPPAQYAPPQMNYHAAPPANKLNKDRVPSQNPDYVNFNPNKYYHKQNPVQQGRAFNNYPKMPLQPVMSNEPHSYPHKTHTAYTKPLPLAQPSALGPKPPRPKPIPLAAPKPLPPPPGPPPSHSLPNRLKPHMNPMSHNKQRTFSSPQQTNSIPPPPQSAYKRTSPTSPATHNFKTNPMTFSSRIAKAIPLKSKSTAVTTPSANSEATDTEIFSDVTTEIITPVPNTPDTDNTDPATQKYKEARHNQKEAKKRKILLPSHNPNEPTFYKQQAKQKAVEEQKAQHPGSSTGFTPVISPTNAMNIFMPDTDTASASLINDPKTHEQKVSLAKTLAESELDLTETHNDDFNEEPTNITVTNPSGTLTKTKSAGRSNIPSIDWVQAANKLGVENLFGTPVDEGSDVDFDEEEKRHKVGDSFALSEDESIYNMPIQKTKHQAHLSKGDRLANVAAKLAPILNPPLNVLSENQECEEEDEELNTPVPYAATDTLNVDTPAHNRVESMQSIQTVETMETMNANAFGEGDFVDLILRDSNNLIVVGIINSYNTMSNLADVRILPSKSHNRGNEVERFVEAADMRYKGFRINDLAVLQFGQMNVQYPSGFDLDYEQFREDNLFPDEIINGWQSGNIPKPTAFELFDGLKCRIKEVNPTGIIIVTILPSTRATTYLLGQRSIKIGIEHIMSLNVFHEKKEQRLQKNKEMEDNLDAFGLNSDEYLVHHHGIQHSQQQSTGTPVEVAAQQLGFNVAPLLQKRATTDRSVETSGGLQRIKTEHVFAAMNDAERNEGNVTLPQIPSSIEMATSAELRTMTSLFGKISLHNKESDMSSLYDATTIRSQDSTVYSLNIYNNAFATDKNVIRDDFIQRRKIMRYHYNVNRYCRGIAMCMLFILCIYFSIWLISEMHLAKYGISSTVNDIAHCPHDPYDSYAFGSSMVLIPDREWYWFTSTLLTMLIYNFIVCFIYYYVFACCLIARQRIYKKCRWDPCLIPCTACYYSNKYRRNKVKETQLAETIELQVAAISHNEETLSSTQSDRNTMPLCLCCVSQIKLQESLGNAENKSIEQITNHFMEIEDYGNADLCFTLFCCYCRCFNAFHYGFSQPPNAANLLMFFDPLKTKEDTL